MQFQVPQFIEIEDKLFGPLTFRQFVYLAGGGGLAFMLYLFLPALLAWPLILAIVAFALALAFYKVNNRPFSYMVESMFKYALGGRLYIWEKKGKKPEAKKQASNTSGPIDTLYVPRLSDSKLKDLSWSLDVHEGPGEQKNL